MKMRVEYFALQVLLSSLHHIVLYTPSGFSSTITFSSSWTLICAFRWVILCNLPGLPFTSLLFNEYFGLYGTQIFQVDTCTQFYFLALQWTISLSCSKSAKYYMWPTTLGKMGYVPNKFTRDTLLLFVIEMEVSRRKMDTSISARNSHIEMGPEFGKTVWIHSMLHQAWIAFTMLQWRQVKTTEHMQLFNSTGCRIFSHE